MIIYYTSRSPGFAREGGEEGREGGRGEREVGRGEREEGREMGGRGEGEGGEMEERGREEGRGWEARERGGVGGTANITQYHVIERRAVVFKCLKCSTFHDVTNDVILPLG